MAQFHNEEFEFRSKVAELSRTKISFAYIDSGATHLFFHSHKVFINNSRTFEGVKAASRVSKLVGKGQAWIPFGGGM